MGMPVARNLVQMEIQYRSCCWHPTPPYAGRAVDRGDHQACAFVVAEGVHTAPGAASGLGDAQAGPE
jgi:hypothetical protein